VAEVMKFTWEESKKITFLKTGNKLYTLRKHTEFGDFLRNFH
jgi:hypothetical protein